VTRVSRWESEQPVVVVGAGLGCFPFVFTFRSHPIFCFLSFSSLVNNQQKFSIVLHYSYRKESLSVWRNHLFSIIMPQLDNSLISHNSSGHAFSSLLLYSHMQWWRWSTWDQQNSKLRNQLVSHRENNMRSNDPKSLEDIWEKVLAPGYPICTPVYSKYPNGVTPSTYWEKGGKSLWSLVSEK